ncbi:TetR/AcrR family transcriptional regulator [Streptomyces sp. NPDC088747]|uniref:TetR/AcrR family transcriptional regulator n=1 Tax=Streptomyces sp. NPDC088747 TaxID=3365886 RepID=UPI003809B20D
MSPKKRTTITDPQSEKARRGRPTVPRDRILGAADELLTASTAPGAVTMDAIAAAAGVGKGTLFRAFGNRDGLLDALFAARLAPWREEFHRAGSPIGPDVPAAERVVSILEQLLNFKLENPALLAAREMNATSLLSAPHYVWVHGVLRDLLEQAGFQAQSAEYTAHLLLGGLQVELITTLKASGCSEADIRHALVSAARRLLGMPADA